jgi:hypothetical protein
MMREYVDQYALAPTSFDTKLQDDCLAGVSWLLSPASSPPPTQPLTSSHSPRGFINPRMGLTFHADDLLDGPTLRSDEQHSWERRFGDSSSSSPWPERLADGHGDPDEDRSNEATVPQAWALLMAAVREAQRLHSEQARLSDGDAMRRRSTARHSARWPFFQ